MILMGYGAVQRIITMGVGTWLQPTPPVPPAGVAYYGIVNVLSLRERDFAELIARAGGAAIESSVVSSLNVVELVRQANLQAGNTVRTNIISYSELLRVIRQALEARGTSRTTTQETRRVISRGYADVKTVVKKG